ncbi:ATP-binding protein [Tardiphaga sp. 20_F10_N6_6]|uniref:ATP-binding protein n=1 Tax=Tardiphaga sp. 20_F10_N6_6 TaxID=3240788 RepID=UPI003F890E97
MTDQEVTFGPFRLSASRRLLEKEGVPVELGARAFDILTVLVERAGEVVGKRDLIDRVWPHITIDDINLRVQVAGLRRALGEGKAGARFVATVAGQGYCFVAPVSRSNALSAAAGKYAESLGVQKLPTRLARMVGRDGAIRQVSDKLSTHRFVTIVGTGGIGKTTVAVSAGHTLLDDFAAGVFFVDLGPVNDPLLVANTIASSVGLAVRLPDPTLGLVNFLRDRRILLIIDSCEHLIKEVAAIAERIFANAPKVHILATSRESLRVEGEHVYPLPALDSPPENSRLTAAQALEYPAVRVFVERAAAGRQRFELSDADASLIGEICRRLDGIALAIELAASRVDAYGIKQTVTLLHDRFTLLGGGKRTALPRHQTLSATLDWSYDLLSEQERRVLRRLSVFAGIFTLDAARYVTTGADLENGQVIAVVASLIQKSLVATDGGAKVSRYRLLDTTRTYAAGKLVESGELEQVKNRHADYYQHVFRRIYLSFLASNEVESFSLYVEHIDNVRAGLEWSFSERGNTRTGIALAAASARLFLELSLLTECHRWAARALAAFDAADRASLDEMELQSAVGLSLMFTRGNSEEARNSLLRGLELAEQRGDLRNQVRVLEKLHIFHQRIGNCREAFALAQRSKDVAQGLGDVSSIALANWALGLSNYFAGNIIDAEENWRFAPVQRESWAASSRSSDFDHDTHARTRCGLGAVLWMRGFPDQAVKIVRDTVVEGSTLRDPSTSCICLILTSFTLLRIGNCIEAEKMIKRLIAHAKKHSLAPFEAIGTGLSGALLIDTDEAEAGVAVLSTAIETLSSGRHELHIPAFLGALAEGLAKIGRFDESLARLEEALARIEKNGQSLFHSEFLRLKGTILVASGRSELCQAENLFLHALEIAERQSALGWGLRAAISAAQLRVSQHRTKEALQILAPIYERYTEGFESDDLKKGAEVMSRLRQFEQL